MPAGLQIFNDYGSVQIDENAETYVLHSKGTQLLNADVYNAIGSDYSDQIRSQTRYLQFNSNGQGGPPGFGGNGSVLAFRPRLSEGDFRVAVTWNPYNSLGFVGYKPYIGPVVQMSVDWWYFTRPSAPSAHGAGLEIYRPDGSVAWSSAGGRPMKMVAVANDTSGAVNVPYSGDWALSVGTPFPTVGEYVYGSDSQFRYQERSMFFQVGNTYVSAMATVSGCRSSYDTGQFTNGRENLSTQLLIDVGGL